MFEVNKQRKAYIDSRGKTILNACPGSGKTTTIAYKLNTLIEEQKLDYKFGGIACLSFTNVAKDEIKEKYTSFANKNLVYPNLISTINSFVNQFITLPFYNLISGDFERPQILESNEALDNQNIGSLYKKKKDDYVYVNKKGTHLKHIYKPSQIVKDLNGKYTFNGNTPNEDKVDLKVFENYAKEIKRWQFKNGILTNLDSIVIAIKILNSNKHIAKALAKRFSYIIIDEAQDTSELQHEILKILISHGVKNIDLVGDPSQSLYIWRDAKPKVFMDLYNHADWNGLDLTDNWRSTQTIINAYSKMLNPTLKKIKQKKIFDNSPNIKILRYDENKEVEAIIKYNKLCSNYKENWVVTRSKSLSDNLRGEIIGGQSFWKNSLGEEIINSIYEINNGNYKYGIDRIRYLLVAWHFKHLSFKERLVELKKLKADYDLNSKILVALSKLKNFELTLEEWTEKAEQIFTLEIGLGINVLLNLKKGTYNKFHKQKMSDLYQKRTVWNFPISTIHQVKGMTLDSIMLFLHKNRKSISITDIEFKTDELTELQSMIYVAMSRPRHLLTIAIEKSVPKKDIIKFLGNEIEMV
tara:strand:+ start:2328 stop:4073 length:1746 start_codon:yes stop_codon:yes gene_type:complete